jgi:hypothetical protein
LKRAAPRDPRTALTEERSRFATTVKAAFDDLFALRKRLSREYDMTKRPLLVLAMCISSRCVAQAPSYARRRPAMSIFRDPVGRELEHHERPRAAG